MNRHSNLKIYSHYTKKLTVLKPEDIIDFANMDMSPAIALTDFNSVRGYFDFYLASKKYGEEGTKPIFGLRTYCLFDTKEKREITILVKNQIGLKNMYKLVSISQMRKEDTDVEPYLTIEEIGIHREGLLIGIEFDWETLSCEYLDFVDYVEIPPWVNKKYYEGLQEDMSDEELKEKVRSTVELLQKNGKCPVATTGANCFGFMSEECSELLQSKGNGKKFLPYDLKVTELVLRDYEFLGEKLAKIVVIKNTSDIADMIDKVIILNNEETECEFKIPDAKEILEKECSEALKRKYGDNPPLIMKGRIADELLKIHIGGWESSFLFDAKIRKKCKELGGLSRIPGDIGSSFVAYLLDITDTNPLPPHYYCSSCKYVEFVDEEKYYSGYDLIGVGKEKKRCPNCGNSLVGDGHNIPCEMTFGLYGDKKKSFDQFDIPRELNKEIRSYIKNLVGEKNLYNLHLNEKRIGIEQATEMIESYCQENHLDWDEWDKIIVRDSMVGIWDGEIEDEEPFSWMYIVPEDKEIFDYAPIGYQTVPGYNSHEPVIIQTNSHYLPMKYLIIRNPTCLSEVALMEKYSGVSIENIDWSGVDMSSFSHLVKKIGKWHRTTITDSNETEESHILADRISVREDVMLDLIKYGLSKENAYEIAEYVRRGHGVRGFSEEQLKLLEDVPRCYVEALRKIMYLFPKAHVVDEARIYVMKEWYKTNYPAAYERAIEECKLRKEN